MEINNLQAPALCLRSSYRPIYKGFFVAIPSGNSSQEVDVSTGVIEEIGQNIGDSINSSSWIADPNRVVPLNQDWKGP